MPHCAEIARTAHPRLALSRSRARRVLLTIALFSAPAPAQVPTPDQPGITLRTTTTLVQVNVVAHDVKGRAVTDLKKEDFQVLDNGRPQAIAVFAAEKAAPAPRGTKLAPFPDDAPATPDRRGYAVILLDYLNSGFVPSARARVDVINLLNRFDPEGKVALFVLDDAGLRRVTDFESGRDWLLSRLPAVTGQPSKCNDNPFGSPPCEPSEIEYYLWRREAMSLGALESLADRLSFAGGRKAVIWVTTGTDVRASLQRDTPQLDKEVERVLRKLNNADVAIYPVDSCALPGGERCASHTVMMDVYAARTGGVAAHGLNGLDIPMRSAIDDVGFTYSMAFYPPSEGARTDFHQIKVEVRRPGVTLQYKQGYSLEEPAATAFSLTSAVPGAEARALAALAGADAAKALEARAASAATANMRASMLLPYFYTAPNVAVVNLAMEIDASNLAFQSVNAKQHAQLTLGAVASRPDGAVAGRFSDTVSLGFASDSEVAAFRKRPYHYEHQFRLAPGVYSVRVSFSFGEQAAGRVEQPLEIAAWDGQTLSLSGIALARETRKAADPVSGLDAAALEGRKALVARSVEVIPTGDTRFRKGDLCQAYLEIYEPLMAGPNPPKLSLQLRVLDRQTGDQKVDSGVLGVDNLVSRGDQTVPVSLAVPVAALSPGAYRLEVKAMHSTAPDSVIRAVDFDVY